jgi:hypothetical protein
MAFTLMSSLFKDGDRIPREFTCDGEDLAPPLAWSDAPEGTRSFALVMEDPDAVCGPVAPWLLYDIPAVTTVLWEQTCATALRNSFGRADYGGETLTATRNDRSEGWIGSPDRQGHRRGSRNCVHVGERMAAERCIVRRIDEKPSLPRAMTGPKEGLMTPSRPRRVESRRYRRLSAP